jgi:hypothetical protein
MNATDQTVGGNGTTLMEYVNRRLYLQTLK